MYKNILPVDEGDMVYNRTKKKTTPHPTIFFFYHTECFQGRCFFLVQQSLVSVCKNFRDQHLCENDHISEGYGKLTNAICPMK